MTQDRQEAILNDTRAVSNPVGGLLAALLLLPAAIGGAAAGSTGALAGTAIGASVFYVMHRFAGSRGESA